MTKPVRAFIAIDVPVAIKTAIQRAQSRLAEEPGARVAWTKPAGIHLTLKFLGDVESSKIKDIIDRMDNAARRFERIKITTTTAGGFPNLIKPRVLWLGVDGGDRLLELQREIDAALSLNGFMKESRRFHPHLTVGRVKSIDPGCMLGMRFEEWGFPDEAWQAQEIKLMSSVLKAGGAEYGTLGSSPLGFTEPLAGTG